MRKSTLEKLRDAKRQKFTSFETDLDGFLRLLCDPRRAPNERRLNPTQRACIYSPERITAYMGPVGCAKTSTIVAKIMSRALLHPGTKWLIGRQDYNDLMDTTMLRAQEMLAVLPPGTLLDRDKTPPMKWILKTIPRKLPDGTVDDEPSSITFMGLKDSLGSYEFNGAAVDEANEVEETRIHEIDTRLRHRGGNYNISLSFNPPSEDHWLYTACTGKNAAGEHVADPWMKLYVPQPDENVRNLPEGYYENLARTLPADMRQRLIEGRWGSTFPGQPVYRQFSRLMHVRDRIEYRAGATLFRFWDFGYAHPCVLWCMIDMAGRLYILRELLGANVEATAFIRLVKQKTTEWFPGADRFTDYGDIAVKQKKDTGQTLALLIREGIMMRYSAMSMDLSLQRVRQRLELLIDREPALQIDKRCIITINAFSGGYRLKDDGVTPHKDGYYDHLMDAVRYGIYNAFAGGNTTASYQVPEDLAYRPEHDHVH